MVAVPCASHRWQWAECSMAIVLPANWCCPAGGKTDLGCQAALFLCFEEFRTFDAPASEPPLALFAMRRVHLVTGGSMKSNGTKKNKFKSKNLLTGHILNINTLPPRPLQIFFQEMSSFSCGQAPICKLTVGWPILTKLLTPITLSD